MESNNTIIETTNINCPDEKSQNYFAVVTSFSCFLNISLFLLIRSKTHPLMKPYLKILYSSVTIDLLAALFQFATQARPASIGKERFLTVSLDGYLPPLVENWPMFQGGKLNYILVPEYFACYSVIIYTSVPFLFRYLIVCHNYHMGPFLFALLLTIVLGFALQTALTVIYVSRLSYETNILHVPIPNPNCTRFLPQVNTRLNLGDPHAKLIYNIWLYSAYVYEYSFIPIIFFAFSVYMFLRKQAQLISDTNKTIQLQISLTLGFQACVPFLVYFGPYFMIHLMNLFGYKELATSLVYKSMFTSYSLVPLVNPLVAILMVSAYRRTFFIFFINIYERLSGHSGSAHVTTLSISSKPGDTIL